MTNARFRKGFSMETAEARRLGRLRMNGCETHAPVRITLRTVSARILHFEEESPPRTKASKQASREPELSSSKQNDRSNNGHSRGLASFFLRRLLLSHVRKKAERKRGDDGARCILNTRILTSKQR